MAKPTSPALSSEFPYAVREDIPRTSSPLNYREQHTYCLKGCRGEVMGCSTSFLQATGGEDTCSCCESKADASPPGVASFAGWSVVCAGSHYTCQPQRTWPCGPTSLTEAAAAKQPVANSLQTCWGRRETGTKRTKHRKLR